MPQNFTYFFNKHGIIKQIENNRLVKVSVFISTFILLLTATALNLDAQVEVHNYPNAAANNTTIHYSLPTDMHVVVKACEQNSNEINTLVDKQQTAGNYNIISNGILHNLMVMSEGASLYVVLSKDNGLTEQMITGKMVMRK